MVRRIFILWVHPLFCDTVRLLLTHPSVEIVGLSHDYRGALDAVNQNKPDTVIIEDVETDAEPWLKTAEIMELFPEVSRFIRMSLKDNELWVYHHEHQSISSSEDFLRIITDA